MSPVRRRGRGMQGLQLSPRRCYSAKYRTHLENEIASLELKLTELGCDEFEIQEEIDHSVPSNTSPSVLATATMIDELPQISSLETEIREQYVAVEHAMSSPALNTALSHRRTSRTRDATKERVIASAEIQAVRMGLTPSLVLSPEVKEQAQSKTPAQNRDSEPEVDVSILASMPSHVVDTLVKKYVQRMLPVHLFLYEPTIWEQLGRVLLKIPRAEGGESCPQTVRLDYDVLVIYLILSVSTTLGSAKVGQGARCMAFSEALFKKGIRHLSQNAAYPSDMAWIQVTLLILQYASINPKLGNVWILSGFAMRNCLELGLHREVSESMDLDPLTIDSRRRIFWAAHCMDRSICAALQRPLSIRTRQPTRASCRCSKIGASLHKDSIARDKRPRNWLFAGSNIDECSPPSSKSTSKAGSWTPTDMAGVAGDNRATIVGMVSVRSPARWVD
ncbi:uncharacterized protein Z519_01680 [Cladophialophora bantiana CBS 173.52]|uniref:Xylanolytic transcriptional activator regulatory domain-containing protein n=1 Tax=Cladophialophora bantiana (strain ATCC 10958 / CBS 173.52 / CDC B-1940 / NIH 8579) TaxID=1442370 RepID=A0A0D2F7N4_CLAB1|nr:uncharacterized protein Z519_01680 [Cladophialophora bantiana CBS 173.52]KIW98096.1 hypothetical protein Z519_01680 [Cladophialophora bantiana CBS 173.52]